MNNAIKYVICAGASLALGFGGGYFFKGEQDKMSSQSKAAQFNVDSTKYANESFKKINSDLCSAYKSLHNINKMMKEMDGSYESGRNSLQQGRTVLESRSSGGLDIPDIPIIGEEGSSKAEGLDDLFKDQQEGEKK